MQSIQGITFSVKQIDISNGVCDPSRCPVALSIKRVFPHAYIIVDENNIIIERDWKKDIFITPRNAMNFICDFDDNEGINPGDFMPFDFELLNRVED